MATPTGRVSLSYLRLITTVHQQRKERMLASEAEYLEALVAHFDIVLGDIHPVEKR